MTEFVGRTGSRRVYSYPETPRGAPAALVLFARNFATGPKPDFVIPALGGRAPWSSVDVTKPLNFTVVANTVTVTIPGDVTGAFAQGDFVDLTPTTPVAAPTQFRSVATAPVFGGTNTTFDLDSVIDATTTAGTIVNESNVPITPKSSGSVIAFGQLTFSNNTAGDLLAFAALQIDGFQGPVFSEATIPPGGSITIPFLAEIQGLTVGVTRNIEVFITGEGLVLNLAGSSINVQEVPVSTG